MYGADARSELRQSFGQVGKEEDLPRSRSKGPPVVLFPSLAGSVLECKESPVEGFDLGTRIWMGLSTLLGAPHCPVTVVLTVSLALPFSLCTSLFL